MHTHDFLAIFQWSDKSETNEYYFA